MNHAKNLDTELRLLEKHALVLASQATAIREYARKTREQAASGEVSPDHLGLPLCTADIGEHAARVIRAGGKVDMAIELAYRAAVAAEYGVES